MAAGVRRIEALTGEGLMKYYADMEKILSETATVLKIEPSLIVNKVTHLQEEVKNLQKENEKLKAKLAKEAAGDITADTIELSGIKVLVKKLSDVDMNGMRDLGDEAKEKLGDCVIVFGCENAGKANLVAMASDEAVKKGAHAGNLIKEIASLVGGGGGGRPNMAQAGGKNPAGLEQALEKAKECITNQINS